MLAELEKRKQEMTGLLEGWSPARLEFRPNPDSWSALEVVDHIIRTESNIMSRARIGLQSPHSIGLRDRAGYLLLDRIFRSQRRVKVPSSVATVLPGPDLDLRTLLPHWDVVRQELGELVTAVDSRLLDQGIFRHPVSGWMSLPQVISFFSVHIVHHGYQLERLRLLSRHL